MNPVLGKILKKISLFCLFSSNIVASLQWALLADPLGETSKLDKPPHCAKVGFIEGEWLCTVYELCSEYCLESQVHHASKKDLVLYPHTSWAIQALVKFINKQICHVPLFFLKNEEHGEHFSYQLMTDLQSVLHVKISNTTEERIRQGIW